MDERHTDMIIGHIRTWDRPKEDGADAVPNPFKS